MSTMLKEEPLVSVLMSVYNEKADWLCEAIDSILNQTYRNFEFIIILDKPSNLELKRVLQLYEKKDNRIKLSINNENIGLTKSLNIGLKCCTGIYILRMDADDISLPSRFTKQIKFMQSNPEVGVCGTWAENFGLKGGIEKKQQFDENLKNSMLDISPFIHPSVIFRTSVMNENKIQYNPNWKFTQDKRLWLDLMPVTKLHNIQEVLLKYRVSQTQISHKNLLQKQLSWAVKMLLIKQTFGENIYNTIYLKHISTKTIQKVKTQLHPNSTHKNNRLIINLYLSLHKYSIKDAIYFIFSGDIFKTYIHFDEKLKVLKRIVKHQKDNDRLVNVADFIR